VIVKVLYIANPGSEEPWLGDFTSALAGQCELVVFDRTAVVEPQFRDVRVVVDQGGRGTRELIDAAGVAGVVLWQVLGTGVDRFDVEYALARGIRLANTPGPFSAVALAEHALLLMLSLAKNLHESERRVRDGRMYSLLNDELAGRRLGVIGLGASGRELARRASALEMVVTALDAVVPPPDELGATGVSACGGPETIERLLRESDYVSLHVPLTPQTRRLLDAERIRMMKPTAVLVNVARGELVDEAALVDALRTGRLRGAGIDVFSNEPPASANPLLHLDNVVLTPHVAGSTHETSRRRGAACADNALRIADGLDPLHEITVP
jgi:D-3-phosphoglycerate dehydrogenase